VTNSEDDIRLVQSAVSGSDRDFARLVAKHQSTVRRFFLSQTLGNGSLSDDLAQETFLKAYRRLETFRGDAAFSTWLLRIAFNVFYDYKRSVRQTTTDIEQVKAIADTRSHGETSQLKIDINQALQQLTPIERLCITLQLVSGQKIEEIAEITHLPDGTIKSHLRRGKQKMATYLRSNGYDR